MIWANARLAAGLEKQLQTLVLEVLDHGLIVARCAIPHNFDNGTGKNGQTTASTTEQASPR